MAVTGLERWTGRLEFAARQGARVAWYTGHGAAMRRMLKRIDATVEGERPKIVPPTKPVPSMRRLLADVAALLARDLANAEAGHYPIPFDDDGGIPSLLAQSRAFFRDVPEVARRRRESSHQEVFAEERAGRPRANLPRYYLQNFHFQSGGWLTEESARIYDMQVEVLFSGAAGAMRRQALVPIARHMRGRDQRTVRFADIATGTGGFITQLRRAFPRLKIAAIDLSEAYLALTMRRQENSAFVTPLVGKAEDLPLADGALDIATAIYLFHELPPKIRRRAAAELARAIRPGGLFVLVDTLQTGDEPDYDGLLELFPQLFHEPYYAGYMGEDLEALFGAAGFRLESAENAFFSRVTTFRRVSS